VNAAKRRPHLESASGLACGLAAAPAHHLNLSSNHSNLNLFAIAHHHTVTTRPVDITV